MLRRLSSESRKEKKKDKTPEDGLPTSAAPAEYPPFQIHSLKDMGANKSSGSPLVGKKKDDGIFQGKLVICTPTPEHLTLPEGLEHSTHSTLNLVTGTLSETLLGHGAGKAIIPLHEFAGNEAALFVPVEPKALDKLPTAKKDKTQTHVYEIPTSLEWDAVHCTWKAQVHMTAEMEDFICSHLVRYKMEIDGKKWKEKRHEESSYNPVLLFRLIPPAGQDFVCGFLSAPADIESVGQAVRNALSNSFKAAPDVRFMARFFVAPTQDKFPTLVPTDTQSPVPLVNIASISRSESQKLGVLLGRCIKTSTLGGSCHSQVAQLHTHASMAAKRATMFVGTPGAAWGGAHPAWGGGSPYFPPQAPGQAFVPAYTSSPPTPVTASAPPSAGASATPLPEQRKAPDGVPGLTTRLMPDFSSA